MAIIEDFGEKIGGARKDIWKLSGITAKDFAEMNELERETHVKKDNIWIKPNWEKLIADGTPQAVAYWQSKMRQSLPPKPPSASEDVQRNYVSVISRIRDKVMEAKDQYDIQRFYQGFLLPEFTNSKSTSYFVTVNPEASGIVTDKVRKAAQLRYSRLEREAKEKLFGVPKDEKEYVAAKQKFEIYCFDSKNVTLGKDSYDPAVIRGSINTGWGHHYFYLRERDKFYDLNEWKENTYFILGPKGKPFRINFPTMKEAEDFIDSYARAAQMAADIDASSKEKDASDSSRKKNFMPPQLAHVRYTGPDYRAHRTATSEMFLEDLKFRGGEFGNWLNSNDRQTSLDMAYDALQNLATLLKIRPEDVSLDGKLAIAFGARGRGGASAGAAHYEPLRQVINLTKMSGAGCLAHEWGHALDHAIGIEAGFHEFASEVKPGDRKKLSEAFTKVLEALQYKDGEVSAEELRQRFDPQIENAKTNLHNWIASEKPLHLPEDLSKAWDAIEKRIMENVHTFGGGEYWTVSKRLPVTTHPDIEELSQIAKFATNHVIPRSSKQQIALWAAEIRRFKEHCAQLSTTKTKVKTDFYKDSIEFDKIYSKMGHGYWQSSCEMFARAFDCYIADKIKEQGYHSDYLSSNADSFSMPSGDRQIYAYPRGEERESINKAFDSLFEDLKERGMLQDAPVVDVSVNIEEPQPAAKRSRSWDDEPPVNVRYEQLSLDEILFSASTRAATQSSGKQNKQSERSH